MATERVERIVPQPIAVLDDLMCGCGSPEDVWSLVGRYLCMLRDRADGGGTFSEWPGGVSTGGTGDIAALWAFLAYIVDHLGLTEHGTSIGGSWLTDAGREALSFLDEHGATWKQDRAVWWVDAEGIARSEP